LTRARIWLSYASVPEGEAGGGGGGVAGVDGGLGLGLGVALGVDPRAGDEGRGGGGTEVGGGVAVGALAGALVEGALVEGVAVGSVLVGSVLVGSVLVGAGAGDPVVAGASTARATVGAVSLHADRPPTRHAAPKSAAAYRLRACDMTAETTSRRARERRCAVGCTTRRRTS
jgi:hypothetical protein